MAKWSNISIGFDTSEETANFGTRAVALSDGGVFESATVATIHTDDKYSLKNKPNCNALFYNSGIVVTSDASLTIFTLGFTKITFSIHFEATILCIELSKNAEFLFCGLSNCKFVCLLINEGGKCLFSKSYVNNEAMPSDDQCFTKIVSKCSEEHFEVYGYLKNGTVLKAYHNDVNTLVESSRVEGAEDISELINFSLSKPFKTYGTNIVVSPIFTYEDENVVLDSNFVLWTCDGRYIDTVLESEGIAIINLEYSPLTNHIICLCEDGSLLVLCTHTFQVVKKWGNELVKAFTILENSEQQDKTTAEIIIITETDTPEICVVELPVFDVKLKMNVAPETYLIKRQSSSEDILYIEGFGENHVIDTLRVKAIAECSPDYRLERLLQRCKFSQAEQFARNLSLNLEEVYKAKVKYLMEKLSFNKINTSADEYFNDLMFLLEKIENIEFVAECCLKCIVPDLRMFQQLFSYASKRLHQCGTQNVSILNLMDEVIKSKITLGTYIQINEELGSPESWLIFSKSNPIMICRNLLLRGEIQKAVIVCCRHQDRIRHELPTGLAVELLQEIPLSLPVEDVLKWLRTYLPIFISAHPKHILTLIAWVIDRTKSLELKAKSVWLEKGLTFVNEVLNMLNNLPVDEYLKKSSALQDFDCVPVTLFSPLHALARYIYQLTVLKNNYSIIIDFEDYLETIDKQNGQSELICLILSKVGESKLPTFIPGFFTGFCAENYLEKDFVLFQYISRIVMKYANWWDIESLWESRALAFIGYIQSIQFKMEAIEMVIANVTVPWSNEMTALADKAMQIDHPLAQEIYHHLRRVPMKLILKKYGFSDSARIEVYDLIKYIYKKNQEGMLNDAKQLVKYGDSKEQLLPYFIYLLHTIEHGEFEKALELIKFELDHEQKIKVIQWAISNRISLLRNRYISAEDATFDAILTLNSTLMTLNLTAAKEVENDIRLLCSFRTLKIKYKLTLPWYKSEKEKEQILRNYITEFYLDKELNIKKLAEDAGEIAHLLNFPRELSLLELCYLYAAREDLLKCVHFLRLILEADSSFFKTHSKNVMDMLTVLLKVITNRNQKIDDSISEAVLDILRKVNLHCYEKYAIKSIELLSLAKLCFPSKLTITTPIVKNYYTEQMEIPPVLPPASYCERIIEGNSQSSTQELSPIRKDIEKFLQSLPHNLSSIHRLQSIIWSLLSQKEVVDSEKMMETVKEKVFNVLVRVVFSRNLDLELALGLLNLVPVECAIRWLQSYLSTRRENWGNLKNASALTLVGKHYIILTNYWNRDLLRSFAEHYMKFECIRQFQRFGIAPKDTYSETHEGKKTLLQKLMTYPEVNISFLHNICRDLNFDFQECLRLYLEHTLLTWEARFEESIDPKTGKYEIIMLSKKEDIADKCSQINSLTTKKDELIDYLKKIIFPRVNFYYYEVFIVIIDIILSLSPTYHEVFLQHQLLLLFLLSYRRISPVSSDEKENWFKYFPELSSVPYISKYRLPFLTLPSDPMKIIQPELTLKTYHLWLRAPSWLNIALEKDSICSGTIMNLKGKIPSNSEWNLHFQHQNLMSEITDCISRIQNKEVAVAALYCVVNHILPPGADRVDAAQRCFLKAQEWVAAENSEEARIGIAKAEKKYRIVSVYHFLYKYQLAKPEYLALSHKPVNLIYSLYHDPSILTRRTDLSVVYPDINKAVDCIGTLHDINLSLVFKELLMEWLQTENSLNSSFEEINILPSTIVQSDHIIRACYLLSGFKNSKLEDILRKFLLSIAFGQESHNKSADTKLRALQCLHETNSSRELEILTARDMPSLKNLMVGLKIIADLEKFALDYTVIELENCNKEELVETLLKRTCPGAIILSAKICVTYQVWSPTLWNSLLCNMTSCCLVQMLEYCLPQVAHIANLLDETVFKEAWECLIFSTLSQLRNVRDVKKEIERSFSLVQSCPLMETLDLNKIINIYRELNYPDLVETLVKFT